MAKVKRIGKGCAVKCLPDKYVVVDIETTGLDPQSNEIIEISALKYEQNVLIDSYHTLVHPNESISGSSNIEMGKKWYENIIFSFIYAIISMKVIY